MILHLRFESIEDVLVYLHPGQWFGWSDSKNKVYSNVIIHDDQYTLPTESELLDDLAAQQAAYDSKDYARKRRAEYMSAEDQLDMQYHDAIDGTTNWLDSIAVVKAKYPKS